MNTGFILILIGGLVLTVGDLIMKKWVNSNSPTFYLLGLIVYLVGLNFLAQSYKYKNIAVASTLFVIFNVVILSVFSWFYFKESLTPLQISGIILGIISVILLEIK